MVVFHLRTAVLPNAEAYFLSSYFESHYRPIRLLGRAAGTVADMRSFCRTWDGLMGPIHLDEIDLPTAANFLRACRRDHSAATCNKYRSYLLAILREARRQRLTRAKWFRRLPRLPEELELPTAWTREQVEALLTAAAAEPGTICGLPACRWWLAICLVLLNTALRIRAALSIRSTDVDLASGFLVCRAGRQKQKAGQYCPLGTRALDAIRAIHSPTRLFLFPWPAHPITLKRHFARICALAGVPAGGHSGYFHRQRCTAITHAWVISPELARQMAGHGNIETTRKHYVDPRVVGVISGPARAIF